MASEGKKPAAGGKGEGSANPRGIPTAPFVDKVEDYVSSRDEVEGTLRSFQELISKYQFMEMNLQRRMAGLKDKIPDIQKTLDTVQFMKLRKDESEPIETTFELNDTLYSRANIPPTEEVYIWLGANVMLSYPIEEAEELLESKLKTAKTSLSNCEEDLDFIREQITTMEVATARVYNWEVVQKRKEKKEEEDSKAAAKPEEKQPAHDNDYQDQRMFRSAAGKLGGALPPAPGLSHCGRRRLGVMRATCLLNRYSTAATQLYDDAVFSQLYTQRRTTSPSLTSRTNETPARGSDAADKPRRPIDAKNPTKKRKNTSRKPTKQQHGPRSANGAEYTEMQLLTKVLERRENYEQWELIAAKRRTVSLPVVLLQILLRHQASEETEHGRELLQHLPSEDELRTRTRHLAEKRNCPEADLALYAYILAPNTDYERCMRLLAFRRSVPPHLLLFILRPASTLRDVAALKQLIDLHRANNKDENAHYMPSLSPTDYFKSLSLLAKHLVRTEPRLLTNLADAATSYIKHFVETSNLDKSYVACCRLFNNTLQIFQPKAYLLDKRVPVANAYFWECQRMLLTLSDTFERPLLISGAGFRAIRNTLAGMPKNETEKHSALLHAPSWPPYLTPGDGMDEITDPESNWSRAVEAGMLMQEAGYAKSDADDSLDILQGFAPDGTPTIQQRTASGEFRPISKWEASIRATRDAYEAWGRFNDPPTKGMAPGINEYAAMFEKLTLQEATATSKLLPGDKARNFPPYRAANLTDIEWAKARPPSVSALYEQMRLDNIIPSGHCLFILVSNAADLDTAHKYLEDAAELDADISSLTSRTINPEALRSVSMGLFLAYIGILSRRDGASGWQSLHRAIALAEARLRDGRSRWASHAWGAILKGCSRHHSLLRMSQPDQINLIIAIVKRIDRGHSFNVANFAVLNKCLRKIIQYDLPVLHEQVSGNETTTETASKTPLRALYDASFAAQSKGRVAEEKKQDMPLAPGSLKSLVDFVKTEFATLQGREAAYQKAAYHGHISAVDRMLSRNDVVKSEHALEYMMAMAYAGEFQEMKRLLLFLIEEWGQPDVVESLRVLNDELPGSADFSEVMCVFRLLGERMAGGAEVAEEMQDAIVESGLPWTWPDEAAIQTFLITRQDDSMRYVMSIFTQMQAQKTATAEATPSAYMEEELGVAPSSDTSGRFTSNSGSSKKRKIRWPFQAR